MTTRHITLATIATLLSIIGSIAGGAAWVKKTVTDQRDAAVQDALRHQWRDNAINQRLDNLELSVRLIASESKRNRDVVNQLLTVRTQVHQIQQVVSQQAEMQRKIGAPNMDWMVDQVTHQIESKKTVTVPASTPRTDP